MARKSNDYSDQAMDNLYQRVEEYVNMFDKTEILKALLNNQEVTERQATSGVKGLRDKLFDKSKDKAVNKLQPLYSEQIQPTTLQEVRSQITWSNDEEYNIAVEADRKKLFQEILQNSRRKAFEEKIIQRREQAFNLSSEEINRIKDNKRNPLGYLVDWYELTPQEADELLNK